MLSVVIPAFNEQDNIPLAAGRISDILDRAEIAHELLFVDDGSTDDTWRAIEAEHAQAPRVRGVSFSRNFGKDAAIFAGLAHARGDCVAVIDCDLQHPPETLVQMYRLWQDGFEVVEGVKSARGEETAAHGFFARLFYSIISRSTGVDMRNSSDFKLLDRKAVDALLRMQEAGVFFRAMSSWVGFKTTYVEFSVQQRVQGVSKWPTRRLVKYALDGITSFSSAPMQIVTALGVVMLLFALVLSAIALYQKFSGIALDGFTTVIIIQLFTGSIIMVSLGVIGYYISKIFEQVKSRPRYVVAATCDSDEK